MIWDCRPAPTPDKVGFSFLVVAWWIAVSPTTLSNLNFINSFLFFSKHPAPVKKEKKKDFKVNSIFLFSDYFVWVWKPVLQSCHKLQNWSWQTFDLPKFWNLVSFIWAAEWLFERFLWIWFFGLEVSLQNTLEHQPPNPSRHSECLNILYMRTFQFYRSCWMDRGFFELAKPQAVVNKYKKPHLLTKFLPWEETGIDKLIHKHCFSIFFWNWKRQFCIYTRYC